VQFDLRFYIIALLFLVFDVEVALFYPWAVIYGDAAEVGKRIGMTVFQLRETLLVDMLIFFSILMLGFAYLWRFGYLEWIKSKGTVPAPLAPTSRPADFGQPTSADLPMPPQTLVPA
jgi:NADH-quinone oxidoreductase subunit A